MKMTFVLCAMLLLLSGPLSAKDAPVKKLDASVAALLKKAIPSLTELAAKPEVLAEVVKRNAETSSEAAADAFQVRWLSAAPEDQAACKPYLENPGSLALKAGMGPLGLSKAFSLDKRGNIASTSPKAHDYLHGKQEKFLDCFKSGAPVVNKPTKDLTSKKFSVQISVPILYQAKTVGVLVGTYSLE